MMIRARQIGFTLLELLVAMSLMVVASACLYSSLYTSFKAKRSAERMLYPMETAQAALDMLEQDLRGVVVGGEDDPNVLAGPFEGIDDRIGIVRDADQITFYSTNHQINGDTTRISGGLGLIELVIEKEPDTDSYLLVRKVTDNILSQDSQAPVEEILCRHVHSLNVRYYDGLRWYDKWDSTDQMDAGPLAVEVTLELEPYEWANLESKTAVRRTMLDMDYVNSLTRLTEVFTLPRSVSMDEVETASEAAAGTGGNQTGQ